MPRFRVTLKATVPTGAVVEAEDENEAMVRFYRDLLDWIDQAELNCEQESEEKTEPARLLR